MRKFLKELPVGSALWGEDQHEALADAESYFAQPGEDGFLRWEIEPEELGDVVPV